MKEKLTQFRCLLTALSATVMLSGCGSNKEDYYVAMPKTEQIPIENNVEDENNENTEEKIEKKTITISAVGDCTLGTDTNFGIPRTLPDVFEQVNRDYSYFFDGVKYFLATDDLTIANLETTLIREENYEAIEGYRVDKKFNFKGLAEFTNILTEGSVEAVNLANNHTFDYGQKGFDDTVENLENANIP